ncbi:RNA polymerase sigma factor (sigma-70 family) [Paenibacillus sp. DS2015]
MSSKGVIIITTNEIVNRRFIKYMASLIHYNSINYDIKRKVISNRYPLILENNDLLESTSLAEEVEILSHDLIEHITDESLYKAYVSLSVQQQKILSLAYLKYLTDKEIAKLLGSSQQNISKHRLKGLSSLRRVLTDIERR